VAWLLPELELGAEPELKPLELELAELEDPDPELDDPDPVPVEPDVDDPEPEDTEPEFPEPEDPELVDPDPADPDPVEDEPELAEVEPDDVLVWCVEPGRARASAPAVTTLAMPTAVVAERTLFRPRSLAAMARRMPSRSSLLMCSILRSRIRRLLGEPSRFAMRGPAIARPRQRLSAQHEDHLKDAGPATRGAAAGLARSFVLTRNIGVAIGYQMFHVGHIFRTIFLQE
jgi:hypothetical protein